MPTEAGRVIIVFGLAGSGKSTLAEGLGRELGLRVLHPSSIVRDLLEGKEPDLQDTKANDGFWESETGAKMLSVRLQLKQPVDVRANEILLAEVAKGELVVDSWSLPWMTEHGVKIRLTAPLDVRAARAAERAGIEISAARSAIAKKDSDTRALFLRLYGFDIFRDVDVFDFEIDTGTLSIEQVLHQALLQLR
jgi:cytidylate kinase